MRTRMLTTVALLLCAAAGWAAEKEALRIEYENGEPGEGVTRWVQTYFVDEAGRLSRIRRITEGAYEGDPSQTAESRFEWTEQGLTWEGSLGAGRLEKQGDSIIVTNRGRSRRYTVASVDDGVRWTVEAFQGRWSPGLGLDLRLTTDPDAPSEPFSGVSTHGARVSVWDGGQEASRLLFNRSPSSLEGTFVAPFETGSGSFSTGFVRYRGEGLWSPSSNTRITLFALLDSFGGPPGWQAFVLVRRYLR